MKRVAYHRLAASELIKSAQFYERRRALLGEEFLSEVEAALERILSCPECGRASVHATRSYRLRRFPFRIFYRLQGETIQVVALAHLSRRPGYWTRRTA